MHELLEAALVLYSCPLQMKLLLPLREQQELVLHEMTLGELVLRVVVRYVTLAQPFVAQLLPYDGPLRFCFQHWPHFFPLCHAPFDDHLSVVVLLSLCAQSSLEQPWVHLQLLWHLQPLQRHLQLYYRRLSWQQRASWHY
jgi:hypothetical protein